MIKTAMNLPEAQNHKFTSSSFVKKPSFNQNTINKQMLDFNSNDSALNRVVKTQMQQASAASTST